MRATLFLLLLAAACGDADVSREAPASPPDQPLTEDVTEADDDDGDDDRTVVTASTCHASYYASGARTANGERFDPDGMTAAHKTLPFGTEVRVTNPESGRSVVVRINDRGPFTKGRCLDLARGAFKAIASLSEGVVKVDYEVLE